MTDRTGGASPACRLGTLHIVAEAARFELAMGINPNPLSRRAP